MSLLGRGERDAVIEYWGDGDEPGRNELLDVMGQLDFVATLDAVQQPVLEEGDVAAVSFEVKAVSQRRFGGTLNETLYFRARFEWVGSQWRLTSCVVQ